MSTEYDGRPGRSWGPFSIGAIMTLILLAGAVIAMIAGGYWWIAAGALLIGTLLCGASAIGVLNAERRQWESARRVAELEGRERFW